MFLITERHAVPDRTYVKRVRRHAPSSLVPLIAATGAKLPSMRDPGYRHSPEAGVYNPWSLLDVAWVSLLRGAENRTRPARSADLEEMLQLYFALDEPMRQQPVGERLGGFLLRLAGQQFVWQELEFSELARPVAMLQHTTAAEPAKAKVITPGWDERLFGCPLSDYVGVAQMLWASSKAQAGRFDPQWMTRDLGGFTELTTPEALATVIDAHFATTARALRDQAEATAKEAAAAGMPPLDSTLRRFGFNPLRGRPALSDFGPGYLLPVPAAALAKVSPFGLYYSGFEAHGPAFAHDLGDLFEQYVGRQLSLIKDATVHPEITYMGAKKNTVKSIDWFVVLDDLVLLVEVKSARPTASLRLGPVDWANEIEERLAKAVGQLQKSADLITGGNPAFAHIPSDRPILGVVATMEPYHLVNSSKFRNILPSATFPVTVAAVSELEDAVVVGDTTVSDLLLTGSTSPDGWSIRASLDGRTIGENPILAQAWESLPLSKP
ncbi:hypothetical protein OG871_39525 (plasmid) [Kitasatospora sp. NBC_00374]|uniref:hypothetical protein n=1 Tax=Kitasatospora sp. NBC_00374 TaxID=2975964 RepID=UPI002F90B1BE